MKARTMVSNRDAGWSLTRLKEHSYAWPIWEIPERELRRWLKVQFGRELSSIDSSLARDWLISLSVDVDRGIVAFRCDEIFFPLFPCVWDGVFIGVESLLGRCGRCGVDGFFERERVCG
jgi:hypothetical protein